MARRRETSKPVKEERILVGSGNSVTLQRGMLLKAYEFPNLKVFTRRRRAPSIGRVVPWRVFWNFVSPRLALDPIRECQ